MGNGYCNLVFRTLILKINAFIFNKVHLHISVPCPKSNSSFRHRRLSGPYTIGFLNSFTHFVRTDKTELGKYPYIVNYKCQFFLLDVHIYKLMYVGLFITELDILIIYYIFYFYHT